MELIGFMREHAEIPDDWPEDLKSFLLACFSPEPSDRSTADQLMIHPFITRNLAVALPTSSPTSRFSPGARPVSIWMKNC